MCVSALRGMILLSAIKFSCLGRVLVGMCIFYPGSRLLLEVDVSWKFDSEFGGAKDGGVVVMDGQCVLENGIIS